MLIAQLSDLHVRPEGMLYQDLVDSNALLAAAVARLNTLDPRPDLVLLSGDLVEKGTRPEYAVARRLLDALEIPALMVPGNHDDPELFRETFVDHSYLPDTGAMSYVAGDRGAVRVVALDVTVPGRHHGEVTEEAAAWLDAVLGEEQARPTVVMMHQPPFRTGVPHLDTYLCREGQRLAEVVTRHPQVERILCGHVHRYLQMRFGGTILCAAPSTTAISPAARRNRAVLPPEPPAFLLHRWRPATGLVTYFVSIGPS